MKRPTRTWLKAARRDTFDTLACALYDIAAWLEDHVRDRGAMTSRQIGGDDRGFPEEVHEHDHAGCLDCDCITGPAYSRVPCTCPPGARSA